MFTAADSLSLSRTSVAVAVLRAIVAKSAILSLSLSPSLSLSLSLSFSLPIFLSVTLYLSLYLFPSLSVQLYSFLILTHESTTKTLDFFDSDNGTFFTQRTNCVSSGLHQVSNFSIPIWQLQRGNHQRRPTLRQQNLPRIKKTKKLKLLKRNQKLKKQSLRLHLRRSQQQNQKKAGNEADAASNELAKQRRAVKSVILIISCRHICATLSSQ